MTFARNVATGNDARGPGQNREAMAGRFRNVPAIEAHGKQRLRPFHQ